MGWVGGEEGGEQGERGKGEGEERRARESERRSRGVGEIWKGGIIIEDVLQ